MHRLIPLTLFLLSMAAACGADGGSLPPSAGGPPSEAGLVYEGASYRSMSSRPLSSLSSSELEKLGSGDTEDGAVDVYRLHSGGKDWQVLSRSDGNWVTWEPLALEEARHSLSQRLGVPEAQVSVKTVERVEWPDACLGVGGEDEVCAQVVTPGFRVVLEARGGEHVYHSDLEGNVRRAPD